MNRKNLVAVLIAIVLMLAPLFFPARSAAAQTDKPQMTVAPAYNGYFKYGEWLPVWVELENQGRDMEAEVRVTVTGSQGSVVFTAPVSLPAGAHKLLPVYVLPNNFSRELDIQLISGGKSIATQRAAVRPQPNISYFIGLLAPTRGALALLNGMPIPGQERPKIITDLTLNELPDRAEGLRSFDLLVLNDLDTTKLTPEQIRALTGWVQQGGRLVIGGGPSARQTLAGLPAAMQPVQVQDTPEIDTAKLAPLSSFAGTESIQAAGPFVAARGPLAENARLLAGDNTLALIAELPLGAGLVDFIAFDLAGLPFNGWPGTQSFWAALVGASAAFPQNLPFDISARQMRSSSLVYPLSNIPSLDLPSIRGLSILLIIYIIIVGPLNFLILRWRRRLHLAWATIPIITILFTAASFGIGYTMRGNDLVMNKISLVELKVGSGQGGAADAAYTSYLGLFSPRQQSYEVAVEGESLISPMGGMEGNPWDSRPMPAGSSGGEMVFVQGQPARVKGLTVNQWAMQSFMSEGTWKNFGQISGDLHMENDVLVGKVRNDTNVLIKDAVLAIQSRFVKLGDLPPGAEVSVNLGLSNLSSDRNGPPLSYRLYQQQFTSGPMPRALELKTNIISTVFESGSMVKSMLSSRWPSGMASPYNGILVFGWIDEAPPSVSVPGNRLTQQTTGLVYTMLNYTIPTSGSLTLPPGLVPGGLVKTPQDGGVCGPLGSASVSMGQGQAEFEFQIPASLRGLQVDTLRLALWRDAGNPLGMPDIALYDWSNQAWITIQDPIQGTNVIQKAAPYVSEGGLVHVQVTSRNNSFGCIFIDIGLEASKAPQSSVQGGQH